MEQKIQLKHPTGKKAVSMDNANYELFKNYILKNLKEKGEMSHTELLRYVSKDFKNDEVKFNGSIGWHMEWVKLDLEAKIIIKRIKDKSQIKFSFIT